MTSCFDAIPIVSSLPSLWKIRWAVGRSKIAIVAPPSELTPPKRTVPTMWNRCTGPRVSTPIVSPTPKCLLLAVFASIAISFGACGQCPVVRTSGLNR